MRKIIIMVLTMCLTHVVYGQETKERDILSSEKNLLSEKVECKLISNEENKCFHHGKRRKELISTELKEIFLNGRLFYYQLEVVCTKAGNRCIIDGNIILYDANMSPIDSGTYHIEHGPGGWVLGCGRTCFPDYLGIPEDIFLALRAFVDFPDDCCEGEDTEGCEPILENFRESPLPLCAEYNVKCCDGELLLEYVINICDTDVIMSEDKMLFKYRGYGNINDIDSWKMPDGTDIPSTIRYFLAGLGLDLSTCTRR